MPAMSMTPPYKWSPLTDEILQNVYASDQDMYPAPLPFARLRSWVDASPDFSMRLTNSTNIELGVIIALPLLRPYWDALLCGKVKETDVDPAVAFPSNSELGFVEEEEVVQEVGLHVFHVERFGGWVSEEAGWGVDGLASSLESGGQRGGFRGGFCQMALDEVTRRAALRGGWKVVGFSGMLACGLLCLLSGDALSNEH
jgi:hypothetical protein